MAIVINGSGTVTGLAVGGLPDGTVDAGTLATNSVDSAELIDGAVDDSHIGALAASKLTGALPAISAANLTAIPAANITGTLPAISGANLTGISGGLTTADMWRLTSTFQGTAHPVGANLERVDTDGFGLLGSGMSQSSGIFTFPSTGYWYITAQMNFYGGSSSNHVNFEIQSTTDNSSYSLASRAYDSISHVTGNTHAHTHVDFLFKVTNTSTHKVRFMVDVAVQAIYCEGDTNSNLTSMSFIKLGDV